MEDERRPGSRREALDRKIVALADQQFGVVARRQLLAAGLSERSVSRRIAPGRLTVVLPGTYRLQGAPDSWRSRCMAALLWAGDGALLSHRSAARLWSLAGVENDTIDIITPRARRSPVEWLVPHRTSDLASGDKAFRDQMAVTSVNRTLLDLGAVVPVDVVELAMEDALRRRLAALPRLAERLSQSSRPGRSGARALRELLSVRDASCVPTQTQFETRIAQLFRLSKILPPPERQYPIRDGEDIMRPDFSFPPAWLAVEGDSWTFHAGRETWEQTILRRNRLIFLGWTVMVVTWRELTTNPQRVLRQVETTYTRLINAGLPFEEDV